MLTSAKHHSNVFFFQRNLVLMFDVDPLADNSHEVSSLVFSNNKNIFFRMLSAAVITHALRGSFGLPVNSNISMYFTEVREFNFHLYHSLGRFSKWKMMIVFLFPPKIDFDIWCKLFCMKNRSPFSGLNKKKKISKCGLLKFAPSRLSIKRNKLRTLVLTYLHLKMSWP